MGLGKLAIGVVSATPGWAADTIKLAALLEHHQKR